MKVFSKLTGLFALLILLPMLAYATPGHGGGVPLDGGLSLLVAAGVGYGAKKIAENRKKNNKSETTENK